MPSSLSAFPAMLLMRLRGLAGRRAPSSADLDVAQGRVESLRQALKANKLAGLAEELAGIGHFHRDLSADSAVWSSQVYRIVGLEPDGRPVQLQTSINVFHPDDRALVSRAVQRTISEGVGFAFDARVVRPDGEIRHVVCRGSPEVSENGEVTGTFGVLMDVTESYRAQEVLRESESRYRLLAENVTDVIVQTSPDGRLMYLSPSVKSATGYDPDQLTGLEFLTLVQPEDRAVLHDVFQATLRGEAPWRVEFRVKRADGGDVWFESCPSALRDPATDEVVLVNDSLRDVSERKANEAELMKARQVAEVAAQVKADFLANMSHELRTPLTSIVGFSTLLRDQAGLDRDTARYVQRIVAASQALLTLVNDILDFSKLEAGQVTLKLRSISPRQMLEASVDMLLPQADAKDLKLTLQADESLPERLCVDPDRMRQVLLNLVGNAIKFTERGEVVVTASYDRDAGLFRCRVRDTGPGIARDQLDRLFVRFSQVDGSTRRSQGGTGLGLAISKALVEAMNGRIGASSTPGEGSCFWFDAPLSEATVGQVAAPTEAADQDVMDAARVLIVDDHQTNRDLARAILTPLGCELSEAEDGAVAVDLAETQIFDLILMDVRMPGMDGPSAVRKIRAGEGPNRNVPILAFTADAADEDRDSLMSAGFDDRVLKPVTPGALITSVSKWLAEPDEDQDERQNSDAA
jgi:PAS domain S-box-containing protein